MAYHPLVQAAHRRSHSHTIVAAIGYLFLVGTSFAQSGDLIGRLGVDLRGKAVGAVRLLEGAELNLGDQAQVRGSVITPVSTGFPGVNPELPQESSVRLQNLRRSLDSKKVTALELQTFDAPALPVRRVRSSGPGMIIRGSGAPQGTIGTGGDVTVELRLEAFELPPGDYGHLIVRNGCVVLGAPDLSRRSNYAFESITVGPGGRIDLAGPVTVETGEIRQLDGCIGKPRFTDWLDLRISNEAAPLIIKGELHAALYAPFTDVTLDSGSSVEGWLFGQKVVVQERANFRSREMPETPGNPVLRSAPVSRKLFRLESGLAGRKKSIVPGYTASYFESRSEPVLKLDPDAAAGGAERSEHVFREAVFRALCHGFTEAELATVTINVGHRNTSDRTVLTISRQQFTAAVNAVTQGNTFPERLAEISGSPLRLNLLQLRLLQITKMTEGLGSP